MTILAGDVGATKTIIGLFEPQTNRPRLVHRKVYSSQEHESLESIISQFLSDRSESINAACFGVPGPVRNGICETTNLSWRVSAEDLKKRFNIKKVTILNDLVATSIAAPNLTPDELYCLNAGQPDALGVIGVVAPGTGLGMGLMVWGGSSYLPIASEGGHVDFAPTNLEQISLLEHMLKKYSRVSVERLGAGPGLYEIFLWLSQKPEFKDSPRTQLIIGAENPSELITRFALEKHDALCDKCLDVYVSILGSASGNLALTAMTTGGAYLGGGVSPKILDKLLNGTFMSAFTNKGRFRKLMESIPVKVILNDQAGLIGASIQAARSTD